MMPNRQPSTGIVLFFDNLIRETSLSCDRFLGIRALSLEKPDRKPQQAARSLRASNFRDTCAAASLKHADHWADQLVAGRRFRDTCAVASLKQPACQRVAPKLAMFPQDMCYGLIEAWCSS